MRIKYLVIAVKYIFNDLTRNRMILLLLILIPTVFYLTAWLTIADRPTVFTLATVKSEPSITVSEREVMLVFLGLAASGPIAAYLALNLMQRNTLVKKRLILAGFQTSELLAAKLIITVFIITLVGSFISLMGLLFFEPGNFAGMTIGYILCGFVYGCYGLLIGSLIKKELEGVLMILLLANIDVGWLQNPVYYAGSTNKIIITWLPAFFPAQVSITSAFTNYTIGPAILESLLYGIVFLSISVLLFWYRMRIIKTK